MRRDHRGHHECRTATRADRGVPLIRAPMAVGLSVAAYLVLLPSSSLGGSYSGANGSCLDYNALYLVDGVHAPDFDPFPVRAGHPFFVTSDSGLAYVDFYNRNGRSVGVSHFAGVGEVPLDATHGNVCVTSGFIGWPDAPDPFATWWYFD